MTVPPDPSALRRRVLLTGALTMVLFFAVSVVLTTNGLPSWLVLVAAVAVHLTVVRPLLRPVREASRLRRALAYQAFLEGRESSDLPGGQR